MRVLLFMTWEDSNKELRALQALILKLPDKSIKGVPNPEYIRLYRPIHIRAIELHYIRISILQKQHE